MAKEDIYGTVPDLKGDASKALSDAMADLGSSFSNKINGSVTEKEDVRYDPENGK